MLCRGHLLFEYCHTISYEYLIFLTILTNLFRNVSMGVIVINECCGKQYRNTAYVVTIQHFKLTLLSITYNTDPYFVCL